MERKKMGCMVCSINKIVPEELRVMVAINLTAFADFNGVAWQPFMHLCDAHMLSGIKGVGQMLYVMRHARGEDSDPKEDSAFMRAVSQLELDAQDAIEGMQTLRESKDPELANQALKKVTDALGGIRQTQRDAEKLANAKREQRDGGNG